MFKKIALAVAVVTLSLPVAAQVTNAGESRVVTLEALGKLASIIDVCMQTPDCKERAAALVAQDVKAWNRVKGEFLSLDSDLSAKRSISEYEYQQPIQGADCP